MGIPPTQPETGFGYIERARTALGRPAGFPVYEVRRFTEKPPLDVARRYVASGRYYWNAGMFFWRVSTFLECLAAFLPATRAALARIASQIGKPGYERALRRDYPGLENISVDYAVMERATRKDSLARRYKVVVLPAEIGWSDIGSWSAVYDLMAKKRGADVNAGPFIGMDTAGNFIWSPKKLVAAIGIRDLILVETEDAILLCPRHRAQDVGKIVKWLEERNLQALL
jgi:mannose-1-phosphate guanylyltransferase